MKVKKQDQNCFQCSWANRLTNKCNNVHSINYHNKIQDVKSCPKFRPKNICLTCYFYSSDEKICKNRNSHHYKEKVGYSYLKTCDRRYDAGYVVTTISDILHLDKKKSYNLMLYKLKMELLKIDSDYQNFINFYNEVSWYFGQSLYYASNSIEEANYYKEKYLNSIWKYIINEDYIEAFKAFKNMLIEIDDKYYVVKRDEDYSKLLRF